MLSIYLNAQRHYPRSHKRRAGHHSDVAAYAQAGGRTRYERVYCRVGHTRQLWACLHDCGVFVGLMSKVNRKRSIFYKSIDLCGRNTAMAQANITDLIKCPACGNECASVAKSCPHCGYHNQKPAPKGRQPIGIGGIMVDVALGNIFFGVIFLIFGGLLGLSFLG